MDQQRFRVHDFIRQREPDDDDNLFGAGDEQLRHRYGRKRDGDGEPTGGARLHADGDACDHQPGRLVDTGGKLHAVCDFLCVDERGVCKFGGWRQCFADVEHFLFRGGPQRGGRRHFGFGNGDRERTDGSYERDSVERLGFVAEPGYGQVHRDHHGDEYRWCCAVGSGVCVLYYAPDGRYFANASDLGWCALHHDPEWAGGWCYQQPGFDYVHRSEQCANCLHDEALCGGELRASAFVGMAQPGIGMTQPGRTGRAPGCTAEGSQMPRAGTGTSPG